MQFSAEAMKRIEKLFTRYPTKEAALLPVLHLAQQEFGTITPEVEEYVAGIVELPPIKVHSVATFYTMYNKKPVGKYHVQVCTNITCSLLGADHLVKYIENKLGVKKGGTTSDGKFTLNEVECLGSCGTAPVMQINDDYHESLTEQRINEILDGLK